MRRSRWLVPAALLAAAAIVVQVVGPLRDPDRAEAIGSVAKPYVLSTPLFTPKSGSNSTLTFASMEDSSAALNIRRYNAVGGLMSSVNITLGAKSSIIAFALANSGAQMHVEIWSPTPYFTMELTYTDSGDVVHRVPYGDMMKPRVGNSFVALAPGLICDTRNNSNPSQCEGARLGSNATRTLNVGGLATIPTVGVTAVSLIAQIISPTQRSWLTFFPQGASRPGVLHVFFPAGSGTMTSDQVTVPLSSAGKLSVYNKTGTTDVIIHVTGYYV